MYNSANINNNKSNVEINYKSSVPDTVLCFINISLYSLDKLMDVLMVMPIMILQIHFVEKGTEAGDTRDVS